MKNQSAQALGRLAAGKPKRFSAEEIERRTKLLERVNKLRRKKKREQPMEL